MIEEITEVIYEESPAIEKDQQCLDFETKESSVDTQAKAAYHEPPQIVDTMGSLCNLATQKSVGDESRETTPLPFNLVYPANSKDQLNKYGTAYSTIYSPTDHSSLDTRTVETPARLSKSVFQPEM